MQKAGQEGGCALSSQVTLSREARKPGREKGWGMGARLVVVGVC